MQLLADRLVLSPSDLNDYVECEHLTTLAREVACGKRSRPHVANQYGELLGRKGEEHEAAYLAHLRGEGRQVVDVRPADRDPQGPLDAVVLALAGLRRLELEAQVTEVLPLELSLPAAGH